MKNSTVVLLAIGLVLFLARKAEGSSLNWKYYAKYEAIKNHIDPNLVYAIILTESSGNPNAFRQDKTVRSIGLMQITMQAARQMGYRGTEQGLFNPKTNIYYGVKYFRWLLNHYNNDMFKALAAYNLGVGKVDKGYRDDRYVNRVISYYKDLTLGRRSI